MTSAKKDIMVFLKEAFCIDGNVELVSNKVAIPLIIFASSEKRFALFKLSDSKRGDFYVGLIREHEK